MLNIMLVEDDEVDVMAVQRMLKKNRVINPIYVADNGLDALAMLQKKPHQLLVLKEHLLILLDFYMPKMNGLEFLVELRFNLKQKEIPVILFTISDEMKTRIETYDLNIAGYFNKPIIFSELTKIVKFNFANSSQFFGLVTEEMFSIFQDFSEFFYTFQFMNKYIIQA